MMAYKFGLAGYPLSHSKSPQIFRAIYHLAGVEGTYELIELPDRDAFRQFVTGTLQTFDGINVTIPYKELAAGLAREKGAEVSASGAANLLFYRNNILYAANTDVTGFLKSIGGFKPRAAGLIGTGGAARAVLVALDRLGTEIIYVHSRSSERFVRFKEHFDGVATVAIRHADEIREELDIVINASPAGMYPHVDQLPEGWWMINKLKRGGLAYDLIYNPPETKFLREAGRLPIKTMNGLRMLVLQAAAAFEIVTGIKIDENKLIKEIEKQ